MFFQFTDAPREITAEQIEAFCADHYRDESFEHIVQPGMVYISSPTELGTVYHRAEIEAIREACRFRGDWRLDGCTLYVTLEPCPMCAGAIINSRIPTVVYGAKDAVTGSCGSVIDLFSERYGHSPAVYPGVMKEECSALLKDFFRKLR